MGQMSKEYKRAHYYANRERYIAANRERALANPTKTKAYFKEYREKNWEKLRIAKNKWISENKKEDRAMKNAWARRNPGKVAANVKNYKWSKYKRCPKWLTKKQKTEIKEFYILAQELSWLSEESLEVDHIVPLRGRNVSGLHVPWNLQILPKTLNRQKRNIWQNSI